MKPVRRSSTHPQFFLSASILAGALSLLCSISDAQAAIVCEKGMGDTEIQCVVRGSSGTHQFLSVTSQLGVPVEALVMQWTGSCSKIETFSRADIVSVAAARAATVAVAVPSAAQCASVLISECKYVEQVNDKGVVRPFACGELLTVKGKLK